MKMLVEKLEKVEFLEPTVHLNSREPQVEMMFRSEAKVLLRIAEGKLAGIPVEVRWTTDLGLVPSLGETIEV